MKTYFFSRRNKRLAVIGCVIVSILFMPFLAMQFTNQVNWTVSDFMVAGLLLSTAGLLIELSMRAIKKRSYKLLAILVTIALLFVVWAELAVGIFGTSFAGS